jgi:ketosteroid isomerase-like protein
MVGSALVTAEGKNPSRRNEAARFVARWEAIWHEHDGEAWPDLLHDGCVLRSPIGEVKREDLPAYMRRLVASIEEHRIKPLRWGETTDGVLIEWVMSGRIASAPFEIHGADRFTLRDGRALDGVAYFDPRPLLHERSTT